MQSSPRYAAIALTVAFAFGSTAGMFPAFGADDEAVAPEVAPAADTTGEDTGDLPAYLEHYGRPFRLDPHEFTFTQKYYWTRLFHPTQRDKVWGAAVLAGAFALAGNKRDIQEDAAESDTPERKEFLKGAQNLGGRGIVPSIAILFYLGGSTVGGYRAKETGYMLAQSALLTGILTLAGQWVLSEDRPADGGRFHPFQGIGHGVSGHTSTAASMAGVLSRMYLQVGPQDGGTVRIFKRIGKGIVYGAPVLVAMGRINQQQHFAYSTLLGLGIGFWTSNAVADAHGLYLEKPVPRWRPSGAGPIVSDRGDLGVGVRWEF
jgi:hypothetical protein